jgi:transposase
VRGQIEKIRNRGLAERFKVSFSLISKFLRRYEETNEIAARPQGGDRRSKIKGKDEEFLKVMVTKQSDIYLREIQEEMGKSQGVKISLSSLSNKLKSLKLQRKKKLNR